MILIGPRQEHPPCAIDHEHEEFICELMRVMLEPIDEGVHNRF